MSIHTQAPPKDPRVGPDPLHNRRGAHQFRDEVRDAVNQTGPESPEEYGPHLSLEYGFHSRAFFIFVRPVSQDMASSGVANRPCIYRHHIAGPQEAQTNPTDQIHRPEREVQATQCDHEEARWQVTEVFCCPEQVAQTREDESYRKMGEGDHFKAPPL